MNFDAALLSRAWLTVGLASAADTSRPVLNRTILVEFHPAGCRFVATDGYVILAAWVPALYEDDPEPGLDESPIDQVVVFDPDGRGRALAGYMLKLATVDDEDPTLVEARLTVAKHRSGRQQTFDGLEARSVIIELPDIEKVILPIVEADYPSWRGLWNHKPAKTTAVALNPEIVGRLAKAKRWGYSQITWTFGGENRAAHIELTTPTGLPDDTPAVTGLVMPIRLDEIPA